MGRHLSVEKIWTKEMEEKIDTKRKARLLTFVMSVISASGAAAFAGMTENFLLLSIVLFPCIIAFSFSVVPTRLPARTILISGIISLLASAVITIYVLNKDTDKLKEAMPLLFQ